jgi:hypothetical protein
MNKGDLYLRLQGFGKHHLAPSGSYDFGLQRLTDKFIGLASWFGKDSQFREKSKTLSLLLKNGIVNSKEDFEDFMDFVTRTPLSYEDSEGVPNTEYRAKVRISNATRNGVEGYFLQRTIINKTYS